MPGPGRLAVEAEPGQEPGSALPICRIAARSVRSDRRVEPAFASPGPYETRSRSPLSNRALGGRVTTVTSRRHAGSNARALRLGHASHDTTPLLHRFELQ